MTEPSADAPPKEQPADRWRPHRAGIRNVWEYDDQMFSFADGRLILRGPNGSGKSNALALLFPFLIEGVMSADAMDPFAGGRSMRTLLLGVLRDDDAGSRRFRHDQRVGYVWMEFVRTPTGDSGAPSGTAMPEYLTIGCGARATAASTNTASWFFVTDQRVGLDFEPAPDGSPLTRGRLIETLGNAAVFDTAEAYRAAVDRAVLGMGADRHQKLTTLIRVLRRPQLAGKLDLRLLSEVLSGGLPALDEHVLDDVAQSLDDLEATQRDLADLKATRDIVGAFVPVYVDYLTGEALGRSSAVIDAAQVLHRANRMVVNTEAETTQIEQAVAQNETERRRLAIERSAADGRRTAVLESPAYRDASSLAEVESSVDRARKVEEKATEQRDGAAQRADAAEAAAVVAADLATETLAAAEAALTEVEDSADAADVAWTLTREEARQPDRLESGARVAERARRGRSDRRPLRWRSATTPRETTLGPKRPPPRRSVRRTSPRASPPRPWASPVRPVGSWESPWRHGSTSSRGLPTAMTTCSAMLGWPALQNRIEHWLASGSARPSRCSASPAHLRCRPRLSR
ncbi:MAG: hypothetical protein R2704_19100 [Microthrixaceae bacterium]